MSGIPIEKLISFDLNSDGSLRVVAAKPDCAICGRPYHAHNLGNGMAMCPIYPSYRPMEKKP